MTAAHEGNGALFIVEAFLQGITQADRQPNEKEALGLN